MANNMTLITDGASHYCEKARWALERAGVPYTETKHVVLLHMLFTRGLGAGTSCPKLVTGRSSERVVLQESPDIIRFADKNIRNEEDRLYPEDPELQKRVQAWGWSVEGTPQNGASTSSWVLMCGGGRIATSCWTRVVICCSLKEPRWWKGYWLGFCCPCYGASSTMPCIVTPLGPKKNLSKWWKPSSKRYGAWLPRIDECPAAMARTMQSLRKTAAGKVSTAQPPYTTTKGETPIPDN